MDKFEQLKRVFRQVVIDVINDVKSGSFDNFVKTHGMGFKRYLDEKECELLKEVSIRTILR